MIRARLCLHKALAFIVKDARIETSYTLQFVFSFAAIFFFVATFHFVAKLVGHAEGSTALARYDGKYFPCVVRGLAFSSYLDASLRGITTAVRQAMTQGTLEMMFSSPTHPMTILAASACWQFLYESVRVVFCLTVAVVIFGLRLTDPNWGAVLVTMLLTVPAFMSLGIMSASVLILFKRGDPINWFVTSAASLISGVVFPVELLRIWLRLIAYIVPLTYSLRCFRGALLLGQSVCQLWSSLLPLLVFSVVMLPLAFFASNWALRHVKSNGTLGVF